MRTKIQRLFDFTSLYPLHLPIKTHHAVAAGHSLKKKSVKCCRPNCQQLILVGKQMKLGFALCCTSCDSRKHLKGKTQFEATWVAQTALFKKLSLINVVFLFRGNTEAFIFQTTCLLLLTLLFYLLMSLWRLFALALDFRFSFTQNNLEFVLFGIFDQFIIQENLVTQEMVSSRNQSVFQSKQILLYRYLISDTTTSTVG